MDEVYPYAPPPSGLQFVQETVKRCTSFVSVQTGTETRALDMGCAVGRSSLELSKYFTQVIGMDFSHAFIEAAQNMANTGEMQYTSLVTGNVLKERTARVPADVNVSRVTYLQGDACDLDVDALGHFDAIFASNLLCRLPKPRAFLAALPRLIKPGGVLALISPYSWLEEYTPNEEWIGGNLDPLSGEIRDSFTGISTLLQPDFELIHRDDFPFLIREHQRKFQLGVSDGTFWRRR